MRSLIIIGVLLWSLPAAAADSIQISLVNARDYGVSIELRDMICDEKVVLRDRMDPGASRTVRVCAGDDGLASVATIVASGCASATTTRHDGVAAGAELDL
jgi:hypothetical protein